jgi:hypothetical protein
MQCVLQRCCGRKRKSVGLDGKAMTEDNPLFNPGVHTKDTANGTALNPTDSHAALLAPQLTWNSGYDEGYGETLDDMPSETTWDPRQPMWDHMDPNMPDRWTQQQDVPWNSRWEGYPDREEGYPDDQETGPYLHDGLPGDREGYPGDAPGYFNDQGECQYHQVDYPGEDSHYSAQEGYPGDGAAYIDDQGEHQYHQLHYPAEDGQYSAQKGYADQQEVYSEYEAAHPYNPDAAPHDQDMREPGSDDADAYNLDASPGHPDMGQPGWNDADPYNLGANPRGAQMGQPGWNDADTYTLNANPREPEMGQAGWQEWMDPAQWDNPPSDASHMHEDGLREEMSDANQGQPTPAGLPEDPTDVLSWLAWMSQQQQTNTFSHPLPDTDADFTAASTTPAQRPYVDPGQRWHDEAGSSVDRSWHLDGETGFNPRAWNQHHANNPDAFDEPQAYEPQSDTSASPLQEADAQPHDRVWGQGAEDYCPTPARGNGVERSRMHCWQETADTGLYDAPNFPSPDVHHQGDQWQEGEQAISMATRHQDGGDLPMEAGDGSDVEGETAWDDYLDVTGDTAQGTGFPEEEAGDNAQEIQFPEREAGNDGEAGPSRGHAATTGAQFRNPHVSAWGWNPAPQGYQAGVEHSARPPPRSTVTLSYPQQPHMPSMQDTTVTAAALAAPRPGRDFQADDSPEGAQPRPSPGSAGPSQLSYAHNQGPNPLSHAQSYPSAQLRNDTSPTTLSQGRSGDPQVNPPSPALGPDRRRRQFPNTDGQSRGWTGFAGTPYSAEQEMYHPGPVFGGRQGSLTHPEATAPRPKSGNPFISQEITTLGDLSRVSASPVRPSPTGSPPPRTEPPDMRQMAQSPPALPSTSEGPYQGLRMKYMADNNVTQGKCRVSPFAWVEMRLCRDESAREALNPMGSLNGYTVWELGETLRHASQPLSTSQQKSALSVKCQVSNHKPVGGAGETNG